MNEVPTADSAPGFLAFVAFFVLALALWFLMRNMNARMRRMSYRQQAAHRGKDDPQVAPGEVDADDPAPKTRSEPRPEGDGTTAGAEGDGTVGPDEGDETDGSSGDGPRGRDGG
ncbi:MAG TPA: hypothetical protein VES93_08390 [Ornithinibacter sp.]|nr:hypothetical protein [Ornithinibacter sp.]